MENQDCKTKQDENAKTLRRAPGSAAHGAPTEKH